MRQIFASSDLSESDLARLYAYPDGPWLRANMVSSADGAAMLGGLTSGLSSQADRRLFALLRTLADVIVVGAGTVRAEKYKPVRQHELWPDLRPGRTPTPPIAVVTARLDLDPSSPVIDMAPPSARTIVVTAAQAPADRRAALEERAEVIVAGQEAVDLKAAVAALAQRGHRRMLTEGGPRLLAQIAAAGLLDELCLTIGPLLAGPGADRILAGQQPTAAAQPLTLAHVLEDNGFLFCRYSRKDHLFRTDHGACPGHAAGCSPRELRRSIIGRAGRSLSAGGCDETATAAAAEPGGVEPVWRRGAGLTGHATLAHQAHPQMGPYRDAAQRPAPAAAGPRSAGPLEALAGRDRAHGGRGDTARQYARQRASHARAPVAADRPAASGQWACEPPAADGTGA
jgi:riboflavin biosynthesis pyrimidine reductase